MQGRSYVGLAVDPKVETEVVPAPVAELQPPLIHIVRRGSFPIALCGARVSEMNPPHTAGIDRCTECLSLARGRRIP